MLLGGRSGSPSNPLTYLIGPDEGTLNSEWHSFCDFHHTLTVVGKPRFVGERPIFRDGEFRSPDARIQAPERTTPVQRGGMSLQVFRASRREPAGMGAVSPGTLLRRADWRFLLPNPQPGKTALFARALLADAVRSVAEQVVDGVETDAHQCELAVLQRPDRAELSSAYAALVPGGACYSEWSGLLPGAPARIRAKLVREGFTGVRLYWMLPKAESARAWFEARPTKPGYRKIVRGIIAHYAAHSGATGLLPFALDVAFALDLFPSICATCFKPSSDKETAGDAPVEFPNWLTAGIAQRAEVSADDLVLVMRAGGEFVQNKVSWLVFLSQSPELRWVAKVPRNPAMAGALRQEHDALRLLADDSVRSSAIALPRALMWDERDGFPVLVQTALDGESLNSLARRSEYPELSRRLGATLSEFAGSPPATQEAEWWPVLVEPWLERLSQALAVFGEMELAPAVRDALSGMDALPLVWCHNDCTPWNAVMEGDRLGLFDWEDGIEEGLPLVDLVYLLANMAFVADGTVGSPHAVRSYRRLIDPLDPRGGAFLGSLDAYAKAVGVRDQDVARLRIATWLAHTAQDLEIILEAGEEPSPQLLASSVCLPVLRAELESIRRRK